MTTTPIKSCSLFFREGSSDKVYHVSIEPMGTLYAVNFAYGRRGSTMNCGTKTNVPVALDRAEAIYDKLCREKLAKGYRLEGGAAYGPISTVEATDTGMRPQLCNAIDETRLAELMLDPDYGMSEKMDGRRIIIRKDGHEVIASNRRGLQVAIPLILENDIREIPYDRFVLDGELIGETYHIFDMLEGLTVTKHTPWLIRYEELNNLLYGLPEENRLHVIPWVASTTLKTEWIELFRRRNAEGVVFKHTDSTITPGRPNSGGDWLKYKFVETCSCVVVAINDKRSVRIALHDAQTEVLFNVGNVTIPPNHDIPPVGSVCEVSYLYAFKEGSLFQPVYKGLRDDIPVDECTEDQLKFKPE